MVFRGQSSKSLLFFIKNIMWELMKTTERYRGSLFGNLSFFVGYVER